MEKLNELVSICETRIIKVNAEKDALSSKSSVLATKEKELEEKANAIFSDFEKLKALNAKYEDLRDAQILKKELANEIKRYKGLQEELKAKLDEAEKIKKDGLSEVADKRQKLQKEVEQIEEKKNEYKNEVMKSISAELNKKGIKL